MICRCGYQNEPEDFYCAQCGRKLSEKKGKGWIIAVVVVLLLVAGAVGAWFLFRKDVSDVEPEEDTTEITEEKADEEDEDQAEDNGDSEDAEDGGDEEALRNGWDEEGIHYYQDGELLTGQQTIDGEYYYFSEETGEKQTGWQNIGDSWYYYTAEGPAPGEGWYEDDKGWFYLEKDGRHYTEQTLIAPGTTFMLDEEGYLVKTVYATINCTPETDTVDGTEQEVLELPGQVIGCTELSFTMHDGVKIGTMGGSPWVVWVRCDGVWTKLIQNTDFTVGEGEVSMLSFKAPMDMDAILISCGPGTKAGFMLTNLTCTK